MESMESANSTELMEIKRQRALLSSLEKKVSGAKLRHAAKLFLHASENHLKEGQCVNIEEKCDRLHGDSVRSILQDKFNWLSAPVDKKYNHKLESTGKKFKNESVVAMVGNDVRVCTIPPSFSAIPCKPVFYDVALNYLDLGGSSQSEITSVIREQCGDTIGRVQKASDNDDPSSSGLVGAAAQSFYGWWSGGGA